MNRIKQVTVSETPRLSVDSAAGDSNAGCLSCSNSLRWPSGLAPRGMGIARVRFGAMVLYSWNEAS